MAIICTPLLSNETRPPPIRQSVCGNNSCSIATRPSGSLMRLVQQNTGPKPLNARSQLSRPSRIPNPVTNHVSTVGLKQPAPVGHPPKAISSPGVFYFYSHSDGLNQQLHSYSYADKLWLWVNVDLEFCHYSLTWLVLRAANFAFSGILLPIL